jgi:hypothetical protein
VAVDYQLAEAGLGWDMPQEHDPDPSLNFQADPEFLIAALTLHRGEAW